MSNPKDPAVLRGGGPVRPKKARTRGPSLSPPAAAAPRVALKPVPPPPPRAPVVEALPAVVLRDQPGPTALWDRANMIRHLKSAADVRVRIPSLGTTVRAVKSDLIEQFRAAGAEEMFVPPKLVFDDAAGVVLVFNLAR